MDEAAIIEWGDSKPSKKFISKELSAAMKEKSRKLVEWLKTAETESEDSDEVSRSFLGPGRWIFRIQVPFSQEKSLTKGSIFTLFLNIVGVIYKDNPLSDPREKSWIDELYSGVLISYNSSSQEFSVLTS